MKRWVIGLLLSVSSIATAQPIYANKVHNVDFDDIYPAMSYSDRVLITGDVKHDFELFSVNYPKYVAAKRYAESEQTTINEIVWDNHRRYLKHLTELYRGNPGGSLVILEDNAVALNAINGFEIHVPTGFCRESTSLQHRYFYCFNWKNKTYRIIDKLVYLNPITEDVRQGWEYVEYGEMGDLFYPGLGPYGIKTYGTISGKNGEPDLFMK